MPGVCPGALLAGDVLRDFCQRGELAEAFFRRTSNLPNATRAMRVRQEGTIFIFELQRTIFVFVFSSVPWQPGAISVDSLALLRFAG
jgi:hypothetical protein